MAGLIEERVRFWTPFDGPRLLAVRTVADQVAGEIE
jgi:hypothetical protein